MYLMAGVHSSEETSEDASAGDSATSTEADALAEETRTTEDEETATGDTADDKGATDEEG